jgi:serine phosphatase RsbU (regulator of sigma subunit)
MLVSQTMCGPKGGRAVGAAVPSRRRRPAAAPGAGRPGPDRLSAFLVLVLPGVWCAAVLALEFLVPRQIELAPLLAAAPAIACAGTGRRQCVLLAGLCAGIALLPTGAAEADAGSGLGRRLGTFGAILSVVAVSSLMAGRRRRTLGDLRQAEEIAEIAQRVVLRPPPPEVGGVQVAARYVSAARGAAIGGDFYEVVDTAYGVRAVVGDVRGHGLDAVECAAVLLGAFREAAYDEPDLADVVRRLDRSLRRHLGEDVGPRRGAAPGQAPDDAAVMVAAPRTSVSERAHEEFVSIVAVSTDPCGRLEFVNCGHPSPYLLRDGTVCEVDPDVPSLPLGLGGLIGEGEDRPGVSVAEFRPGDAVLLYTDGVSEARDGSGEFFPLGEFLHSLKADDVPEAVVGAVLEGVSAHCGGDRNDDLALLLLRKPAA